MKKTLDIAKIIILGGVVALSMNYLYAAWTPPTGNPGTANAAAPINTSSVTQTKTGGLIVEGFRSNLLTILAGGLQILDGGQGEGKILTSSADGTASWKGGDDSLPPKMYILNDGSNTTTYQCIDDVDLEDYCGDEDGCMVRFFMNHKTNGDDLVRTVEALIYMEEPETFSNNQRATIYGWTRGEGGGDVAWQRGDGIEQNVYAPWGWAWIRDFKTTGGCSVGPNVEYTNPYTFSLMVHPAVRAKIIFYDNGPGGEPVLGGTSVAPEVFIYRADFSGDSEGCSFNAVMPSCNFSFGWKNSSEWNWPICQNAVKNKVSAQCPAYAGSTWVWTDNRTADLTPP